MQIDFQQALTIFDQLDKNLKAPGLHPRYAAIDAERSNLALPVFWIYEEGKDIYYHSFHLMPIEGTEFYDVQSPYGYGGPVATTRSPEFLSRAWSAYSTWTAEHHILTEFVRFHPLLENWCYFNGNVIDDRPTVWIKINHATSLSAYKPRARTAIRKAIQHGLQVEWWQGLDFLRVFPPLYHDLMAELKANRFYDFPARYFQALTDWEAAKAAVCLDGSEVIAAAVFLHLGNILEYHLSAASTHGKKLNAAHLLLHEAITFGQQLNCPYLHLGGGTNPSADNSLLFFKSGFSRERACFKIGTKVHLPGPYQEMKIQYQEHYGQVPSRFQFYRFN